jgi:phage baseplate assembly protein W
MAYRIPNKNPIDVGSRVAIGVSLPFNVPQVFTQTYTTQEQIKSNIINYILTDRGERVFNPTFGSNIRTSVFENITPNLLQNLQITLQDDLKMNFPSVNFYKIEITPDYDRNIINIAIYYSVYNNPITEINITL